jgi:hypothetical protein
MTIDAISCQLAFFKKRFVELVEDKLPLLKGNETFNEWKNNPLPGHPW